MPGCGCSALLPSPFPSPARVSHLKSSWSFMKSLGSLVQLACLWLCQANLRWIHRSATSVSFSWHPIRWFAASIVATYVCLVTFVPSKKSVEFHQKLRCLLDSRAEDCEEEYLVKSIALVWQKHPFFELSSCVVNSGSRSHAHMAHRCYAGCWHMAVFCNTGFIF